MNTSPLLTLALECLFLCYDCCSWFPPLIFSPNYPFPPPHPRRFNHVAEHLSGVGKLRSISHCRSLTLPYSAPPPSVLSMGTKKKCTNCTSPAHERGGDKNWRIKGRGTNQPIRKLSYQLDWQPKRSIRPPTTVNSLT